MWRRRTPSFQSARILADARRALPPISLMMKVCNARSLLRRISLECRRRIRTCCRCLRRRRQRHGARARDRPWWRRPGGGEERPGGGAPRATLFFDETAAITPADRAEVVERIV